MKSQVALEYLIIIAFGIAAIIPIFYYSLLYSSDSVITSQTQDAVNTLAKTADYVYSLGTGSTTKVSITIPQKVTGSLIEGKLILINLTLSSGVTNIKATTKANVSGSIPTTSGTYTMRLNMTGVEVKIEKV